LGRLKPIIGFLLILLSIGGLLFWELEGRKAILMEEIIVAKEDIQKGQKINNNMFTTMGIPTENILQGALTPKDIDTLQGKISAQLIVRHGQIVPKYFQKDNLFLHPNEAVFVLKAEWIAMRSSTLRRGDTVDIYGEDGRGLIGTFKVAFVKDEAEREVRDVGTAEQAVDKGQLLDRTDSSSVISHIEIIATMEKYQELVYCTEGEAPTKLLIVQRGEKIDT